jgi:hypothetical protein
VFLSTLAFDIPVPVCALEVEELIVGEHGLKLNSSFHANSFGASS